MTRLRITGAGACITQRARRHATMWAVPLAGMLLLLCVPAGLDAQPSARRLTTVDALRQFPGYYHLQNVLLRGTLEEADLRLVLRTEESEIRVVLRQGVTAFDGSVEIRGQFIDVGRLREDDPRLTGYIETRSADAWPRPGEELFIHADGFSEAQLATTPSVRALALEPWRFDGQTVTLVGNFRGRNLFGDLPDAPRSSANDFVLRGADGAVWVTGLRPRGRGFDLDVTRRVDTDRWISVTGRVRRDRGLVIVEGAQIALASEPEQLDAEEELASPARPMQPAEVVFSAPTAGETGVPPSAPVRIQFSRGIDAASLTGRLRVTYLGDAPDAGLEFEATHDVATRSVAIRFAGPLEPFRTVRVELLDGVTSFDGAPVLPWTITFSVGG